MAKDYLKFSFSLPVYNEGRRLKRCLDSISCQDYPKDKIEVLLVDGGSTDNTVEIASQYDFVKVFNNPRRLADFGAKISAKEATGDLLVIFAADNGLVGKKWLDTVNCIFLSDEIISAFWCKMISAQSGSAINKYYELIQNDPLSYFVNRNIGMYMEKAIVKKFNDRDCYVFNVGRNKPLIWGANGLTYRTELVRGFLLKEGFLGDNDIFQEMVEAGNDKVAYSHNLLVYHHHVNSLGQWISKWKRNYTKHFLQQRETRNLGWVIDRNFKKNLVLWVIYSLLPVFSLGQAVYFSIRDKTFYWFYHPLVSFCQVLTYISVTLTRPEGRRMLVDFLRGKFL